MEVFNIDTSKESIKDTILLAFTDIIVDFISKSQNISKNKLKRDIFNKFIELEIFDNKIHTTNINDIKNKIISALINDNINVNINMINPHNYLDIVTSNDNFELIGSGSFANVYKIKNLLDDKYYAVKKIGVECTNYIQILTEVKLMADLCHTNVIRYHTSWIETIDRMNHIDNTYKLTDESTLVKVDSEWSLCSTDSTYDENKFNKFIYIQMELCKMTLKEYLLNNTLSYTYKINICNQICNGIKYIHQKDIIHRDLKLQNIFISNDDIIKIADFGLATKIYNIDQNDVGTCGYIAPEVLQYGLYSFKSDMYSLGVIILEIFVNFTTLMEKHLFLEKIEKYDKIIINENIDKIIKSLLNKNADDRMEIDEVIKLLYTHNHDIDLKIN
jgi:serine/threonine protein kinase